MNTNPWARLAEIEQEGIDLYLKHNNAFAMAFDSLDDAVQEEYYKLYKEYYGQEYENEF